MSRRLAGALTGIVAASLTMSAGATVASMGGGPDSRPAGTSPAMSALADPNPPTEEERENSSSTWWWVGGVIGAGAFGGIVLAARRRTAAEAWARRVSTICDTGRALGATIAVHLGEASTWDPPDRVAHQRARVVVAVPALRASAPSDDLRVLIDAVGERIERLGRALDSIDRGEPIEATRAAVEPLLVEFGDALGALEHEVTDIVIGASLPSGRTTG